MCSPMVLSCQKKTWHYFFARTFSYFLIGILSGLFGLLIFKDFLHLSAKKLAYIVLIISFIQIFFLIQKNKINYSINSTYLINKICTYSPLSYPATLGIITAILPCGFLYSAILMSASFASPILSGVSMLVFALSTSPILIGSKILFNTFIKKNTYYIKYISIILLLIVAGMAFVRTGIFSTSNNNEKIQNINTINCH